jgi:hypothetical protein
MGRAVCAAFNRHIRGEAIVCNAIHPPRRLSKLSSQQNLSSSKQNYSGISRHPTEAITMKQSEPSMNRREWFRLRIPKEANQLPNAPRLRPMELPPNNDGMDLNALPPMCEALISREEVRVLFSDLADHAENIQLFHKERNSRGDQHVGSNSERLHIASSALLQGLTARIQIRYSWNGAHWIDTLEAKEAGYRLVRIEHRTHSS